MSCFHSLSFTQFEFSHSRYLNQSVKITWFVVYKLVCVVAPDGARLGPSLLLSTSNKALSVVCVAVVLDVIQVKLFTNWEETARNKIKAKQNNKCGEHLQPFFLDIICLENFFNLLHV